MQYGDGSGNAHASTLFVVLFFPPAVLLLPCLLVSPKIERWKLCEVSVLSAIAAARLAKIEGTCVPTLETRV